MTYNKLIARTFWLVLAGTSCAAGADSLLDADNFGADDQGSGAGGGLSVDGPDGSEGGHGDGFEPCAVVTSEAQPVPVSMFLAVDQSGSMRDDDKWLNATAAFTTFFTDPAVDDMHVALRLWPTPDCDDPACDAVACSQPQIELAPLSDPDHEQDLVDLFVDTYPNGSTPMSAALAGAATWAKARQESAGASEKVVVVLLTDGEPNGCDEDIAAISAHAADAYDSAGIPTFAVGLDGSNEAQLDAIALAGGTTKGFFIGAGNAAADLTAALLQIQSKVVSCSFFLPESPVAGEVLDPNLVTVKVTPEGGVSATIAKVTSASACGDGPGWYYDDPASPTTITLCPASCTAAQAAVESKVELDLGCKSEIE